MTTNRAESNALTIASCLVAFTQRHGDPISNLKLQKLLYYAEGWHLALHRRSLFSDVIQAWPRGPAVYSVWKQYSGYRWEPISRAVQQPSVSKHVEAHIEEVMSAYGDFSAYSLERMTHEETPWLEARQGLTESERSNRPISRETMMRYFTDQARAA